MTILILHGGGGPATVAMIAAHVGDAVLPTHPGWNGTPRPDDIRSIGDLAELYLAQLDGPARVIGSSIGGWIGAEMAVRDQERISQLVLIDAVGIEVPGEPITDFFALDARGVAEHAWHDSERFYAEPGPEQQANVETMRAIAGDMYDPALRAKLAAVTVPTLVVWGESDRIVTPAYGRAYADAFANARFALIAAAGHLPQIEQPAATFAALDS
jgi:pimeloyl-ACP methyl ester carboxylesterase